MYSILSFLLGFDQIQGSTGFEPSDLALVTIAAYTE